MIHNTRKTNLLNEGLITALAVGGFLIILGAVFGLTPGIPQKIWAFFGDLTGQVYPIINGNIVLPAPTNPAAHIEFFGAIFNFMVGIVVLQIAILALRFWVNSPIRRIAETVGNIVFWLGGSFVVSVYLLSGTLSGWFSFWASLIIIVGLSLIVRGIILFLKRRSPLGAKL